jgi:hypothetical protein
MPTTKISFPTLLIVFNKLFSFGNSMSTPDTPARVDLSEVYQSIADAAVNVGESWPEADKFRAMLDTTPEGKFVATSFPDDDGPLGVFALIDENEKGSKILQKGSDCFDRFCVKLHEIFSDQDENTGVESKSISNYILRQSPKSLHISICIYQEHPKLLKDSLPADWTPISQNEVHSLLKTLSDEQSKLNPPTLRLERILWTPDGALIAGFVEESSNDFIQIKASCQSCGLRILKGAQPTRVKSLIHVTLGRVVGLPPSSSPFHRLQISKLVKNFNENVFPALVQEIRTSEECNHGKFPLREATLLRNRRWLLEENFVYGSWTFSPQFEND